MSSTVDRNDTPSRSKLVHDVLDLLNNNDTIGMARDIADELMISMEDEGRTLDSIKIGEIRREIALYRETAASVAQALAE